MTDSQALPSSALPITSEVSVGDALRRAREAQGFSVAEAANALKLNARQIEALEGGRFDELPGLAFTRGFLRNYARLLKLDAAPLLASLEVPGDSASVELTPASNAHGHMPQVGRGRFRRSVLPGVVAALGLFGVVVAGWYFDTQKKKAVEDVVVEAPTAAVPAETKPPETSAPASDASVPSTVPEVPATPAAPAVSAPAPVTPAVPSEVPAVPAVVPAAPSASVIPPVADKANAEPVKSESGVDHLVFEFAQDAWVEVKDKNGKILLSQLGKAGGRREVSGTPPLLLVVGNARNVKLQRNGNAVDLAASTKVTVARLKLE